MTTDAGRRHRGWMLAVVLLASALGSCDEAAGLLASARPPSWPDQSGPAVQLGSGQGPAGRWTGWLYPTAVGYCVDLVDPAIRNAGSCGSGSDPFAGDIGVSTSGSADLVLAWGATRLPDATTAEITTRDGQTSRIPIVRPGGPTANGFGYFMARFEPGNDVRLIVLRGAADAELDRYQFDP